MKYSAILVNVLILLNLFILITSLSLFSIANFGLEIYTQGAPRPNDPSFKQPSALNQSNSSSNSESNSNSSKNSSNPNPSQKSQSLDQIQSFSSKNQPINSESSLPSEISDNSKQDLKSNKPGGFSITQYLTIIVILLGLSLVGLFIWYSYTHYL